MAAAAGALLAHLRRHVSAIVAGAKAHEMTEHSWAVQADFSTAHPMSFPLLLPESPEPCHVLGAMQSPLRCVLTTVPFRETW